MNTLTKPLLTVAQQVCDQGPRSDLIKDLTNEEVVACMNFEQANWQRFDMVLALGRRLVSLSKEDSDSLRHEGLRHEQDIRDALLLIRAHLRCPLDEAARNDLAAIVDRSLKFLGIEPR